MYEKQTWATGDVITEEKLNHMEDGISNAGGVMVVNENDVTLDKTWKEIYDAYISGMKVLAHFVPESEDVGDGDLYYSLTEVGIVNGVQRPFLVSFSGTAFYATTEDGYPSGDSGGDIG